jgi:hypothetical protein
MVLPLPPVTRTGHELDAWLKRTELLQPGARVIARRHGVLGEINRMPEGSMPVFDVGDAAVLKLFAAPHRRWYEAERAFLRVPREPLSTDMLRLGCLSKSTASVGGANVRGLRRGGAFLLAIVLFVAAPMMSVASAASEPITVGEWMSAIFGTWSKKVDPAQKGLGVAGPLVPPPQLQSSSEPAPPKAPPATAGVPRQWLDRRTVRRKPVRRLR